MATLRPLDPPHKGIRNALSQLSLAAGSTAAPDTAAVEALATLCIDVLDFLDEHADFEEKYILEPLDERVPGAGADDHAAEGDELVDVARVEIAHDVQAAQVERPHADVTGNLLHVV